MSSGARVTPSVVLVVALGGAVGALLRYLAGQLVADPALGTAFPQTTFAINVVGSFALALLPAIGVVRRTRLLALALGPGLLGGFTTLSAASEQTRALLGSGSPGLALVYLFATLIVAVLAVALGDLLSTRAEQRVLWAEGGEE